MICFGFLRGQGCVESKNKTSAKRKSSMSSLNPSIIQVGSFKCRADVPLQLNSVSDKILIIVLDVYSQVTKFHLIISVWIHTFAQWLRFLLHLLDVLHPFGQCGPEGFREDKREEGSEEGRAAHQEHRQLLLYLGEL